MYATKIKNSNHIFGRPADWDESKTGESCGELAVFVERDPRNQMQLMHSVWMPDEAELAALNAGHGVMLTIFGPSHPAVMLGVTGEKYSG